MDNQQSYDLQVEAAIKYARYANGKVQEARALLDDADREMSAWLGTINKLDPNIAGLKSILAKQHSEVTQFVQETMDEIAMIAVAVEVAALLSRDSSTLQPAKVAILQSVRETLFGGAPMMDWIRQHNTGDRDRVIRALKERLQWGDTIQEIRTHIIGTRNKNRKNGLREMTRRGLETLIRTAVAHSVNSAKNVVYTTNSDKISKLHWVSVLDTRTSDVCRNLHGRVYNVGEGPRPPVHPNCRSMVIPVFKNDSRFGALPRWQQETWLDWFDRQPDDVKKEALGARRFALYKKSGVKPKQFYNADGEKYTLKELQDRLPDAFKRAGI